MIPARRAKHALRQRLTWPAVALGLVIGGCSGSVDPSPPAGLGCVDDSKHCLDQRAAALQSMMADRQRAWVRDPVTPAAYASGVRLFAYKSRKRELSCEELAIGKREADQAGPTLRSPAATNLTPAQVSRGTMLANEVSKELGQEMVRRCRV